MRWNQTEINLEGKLLDFFCFVFPASFPDAGLKMRPVSSDNLLFNTKLLRNPISVTSKHKEYCLY